MRLLDQDHVVARRQQGQLNLLGVLALRVCGEKRLCIPGGHFEVARVGPCRSASLRLNVVLASKIIKVRGDRQRSNPKGFRER